VLTILVSDPDTPGAKLTVAVSSQILPTGGKAYPGPGGAAKYASASGTTATFTFTWGPVPQQGNQTTGTVDVTIEVSDGQLTASSTFSKALTLNCQIIG
jgi:hypothetical protein